MKWENYGCKTESNAKIVKQWLDEHGVRTGEIFECYGIWKVPYMAIGREQKEMVYKETERWCFEYEY